MKKAKCQECKKGVAEWQGLCLDCEREFFDKAEKWRKRVITAELAMKQILCNHTQTQHLFIGQVQVGIVCMKCGQDLKKVK